MRFSGKILQLSQNCAAFDMAAVVKQSVGSMVLELLRKMTNLTLPMNLQSSLYPQGSAGNFKASRSVV